MPHCIIEHSIDLKVVAVSDFLTQLHEVLSFDGEIQLHKIKTRLIPCQTYLVGDTQDSFLALTLKLMPGRSPEWKQQLGQKLYKFLKYEIDCEHISVEILELNTPFYIKSL